MMMEYIYLFCICVAAFILKAMTGFGPTIIVISFGSLFILPHELVSVAAVLDLTAGLVLVAMEKSYSDYRFWIPLVIAIVMGSVLGGFLVKFLPVGLFHQVMGIAIFIIGIFFVFGRSNGSVPRLPPKSTMADRLFAFLGGFSGGLVGIDGPPLIWHFGIKFTKEALRKVLIPVFLAAAIARTMIYSATGLMTTQVALYCCAALPGLLAGIYFGNKIFHTLNEGQFKKIIGAILILISLKHLI